MSTATPVPETWELTGDDALRGAAIDGPPASSCATRSCACASPTVSATPGRSRTRRRSCSCRRSSPSSGSRPRSGRARTGSSCARSRRRSRARPATSSRQAVVQAHPRRRLASLGRAHLRARRQPHHRQHADGAGRARAEPHLRHRAGPPDAAEVRAARSCSTVTAGRARHRARSRSSPSARRSATRSTTHALNRFWGVVRWPARGRARHGRDRRSLFRCSPRRRQPALSWLAFGAAVSARSWLVVTIGLGAVLLGEHSRSARPTDRSPAWSRCCCGRCSPRSPLLFGGAVAAQLEAVRAGAARAAGPEKVEHSEPEPSQPSPVLAGQP